MTYLTCQCVHVSNKISERERKHHRHAESGLLRRRLLAHDELKPRERAVAGANLGLVVVEVAQIARAERGDIEHLEAGLELDDAPEFLQKRPHDECVLCCLYWVSEYIGEPCLLSFMKKFKESFAAVLATNRGGGDGGSARSQSSDGAAASEPEPEFVTTLKNWLWCDWIPMEELIESTGPPMICWVDMDEEISGANNHIRYSWEFADALDRQDGMAPPKPIVPRGKDYHLKDYAGVIVQVKRENPLWWIPVHICWSRTNVDQCGSNTMWWIWGISQILNFQLRTSEAKMNKNEERCERLTSWMSNKKRNKEWSKIDNYNKKIEADNKEIEAYNKAHQTKRQLKPLQKNTEPKYLIVHPYEMIYLDQPVHRVFLLHDEQTGWGLWLGVRSNDIKAANSDQILVPKGTTICNMTGELKKEVHEDHYVIQVEENVSKSKLPDKPEEIYCTPFTSHNKPIVGSFGFFANHSCSGSNRLLSGFLINRMFAGPNGTMEYIWMQLVQDIKKNDFEIRQSIERFTKDYYENVEKQKQHSTPGLSDTGSKHVTDQIFSKNYKNLMIRQETFEDNEWTLLPLETDYGPDSNPAGAKTVCKCLSHCWHKGASVSIFDTTGSNDLMKRVVKTRAGRTVRAMREEEFSPEDNSSSGDSTYEYHPGEKRHR